jgi:hypothetical protein
MPTKMQGAPRLFRTYETEGDSQDWLHNCKIWEAARATTAAPTFFKQMDITRGTISETFMDGAMGCNNPTSELLNEAERFFDKSRKLGCFLSLGTGTRSRNLESSDANSASFLISLAKNIKDIAVDTEAVHQRTKHMFDNYPRTYFRFNVPDVAATVGLADWEKMGDLRTTTEEYLQEEAVSSGIDEVVDILWKKIPSKLSIGHGEDCLQPSQIPQANSHSPTK